MDFPPRPPSKIAHHPRLLGGSLAPPSVRLFSQPGLPMNAARLDETDHSAALAFGLFFVVQVAAMDGPCPRVNSTLLQQVAPLASILSHPWSALALPLACCAWSLPLLLRDPPLPHAATRIPPDVVEKKSEAQCILGG